MKKLQKRKGFTLTELAIVIAVIAILIAVLVPTFVSLINRANESADEQAVKSMNTSLAAAEAIDGKPDNAIEAMDVLKADGFNVENYVALDSGNTIYYDATYNRCLIWTTDENGKSSVSYPSDLASTYSSVTGVAANWYTFASIYNQTADNIVEATTAADITNAISNATAGDTVIVQLENSITVTSLSNDKEDVYVTVDLNEQTLTMNTSASSAVSNGSTLYIKNGTIDTGSSFAANTGVYTAKESSSITLEGVDVSGYGSILYPSADAAQINVINSTIYSTNGYALATNAKNGYSCTISIENSTLQSSEATAVCINVDAEVTINNSTIIAGVQDGSSKNTGSQTILLRAGTVNMANSTVLYYREDATNSGAIYWDSGNNAPRAAIVIGDATDSYTYADAELNMTNCTVSVVDNTYGELLSGLRAIYMYGKDETGYKSTLNFDSSTTINGQLIVGGSQDVTIQTVTISNEVKDTSAQYECAVVHINGTSYSPETTSADANGDTTKGIAYTVSGTTLTKVVTN